MPDVPHSPVEYWDLYKPYRGEGEQPAPDAAHFNWTPYPGHGPGAQVLHSPATALDLGGGEGAEAVHLARSGAAVTAVDFSAVQVARARRWWADEPGVTFEHAEACDYLAATEKQFDAIYSVWGAVWFTDPDRLLPLVRRRLAPGGVFAFAHENPDDGVFGPQRMGGKWLEGRDDLTVRRWQYPVQSWSDLLKRHGFQFPSGWDIPGPGPDTRRTLLVRAVG